MQVQEVLNELVIDRGSSSFLTNIECYEKGRYITRVQADGIMLATPTGALRLHALVYGIIHTVDCVSMLRLGKGGESVPAAGWLAAALTHNVTRGIPGH